MTKTTKTFLPLVAALVFGFAPNVQGATNSFKAVTSGIGQDGTSWLKYVDPDNWTEATGYPQDDALGYGNAILNLCAAAAGRGRYIELPESLTVHRLGNVSGSLANYPVLRGDGTLRYVFVSTDTAVSDLRGIWLYSPYFLEGSSGYAGFVGGHLEICGPLVGTSFSSSANNTAETGWAYGPRIAGTTVFNYSKFATEQIGADGVRTVTDWPCDYQVDRGGTLTFVSPCGAAADVLRSFVLTDQSPFAKLAAGETNGNLPVGTAVTGSGVDSGTYLKRLFPDGSIELSKPATASSASSELRFAAVDYKTTVLSTNSRFRVQNQSGERTLKLHKFRAEDDFEVSVKQLLHRVVDGASMTMTLTITTDDGYLPGRLRIVDDVYKHSAEVPTDPFTVILGNCHIVPPSRLRGEDVKLTQLVNTTARITVDTNAVRPTVGTYVTKLLEVKGSLVKDGVGTWNVAFPGAVADYSGKVTVEAGTLLVANANATLGEVELKAGAALDASAGGISVSRLIAADGAIISGGSLTADVLVGNAEKLVFRNGGVLLDAVPSSAPLSLDLISGKMLHDYEAGDSIAIFTTNSVLRVNGSGVVDILVVGGGGGAGGLVGSGGGGGGGVIYRQQVALASGYYSVVVGQGGKGAIGRGVALDENGRYKGSYNGENSAFNSLVALGGGAGGGYNGGGAHTHPDSTVKSHVGVAGGSGGGGGVLYPENGSTRDQKGGAGTAGQGNAGAKSCIRRYSGPSVAAGGGGGGAGAAAVDAGLNSNDELFGSNGGDGLLVPIWGNRYWGGGGAGSAVSSVGVACVGGKGGGGDSYVGQTTHASGEDGEPNTGGGGGAATSTSWDGVNEKGQHGGNGGSGIVIVRFTSDQFIPVDNKDVIATGGQISRKGGFATHTFLADGTFTMNEGSFVDVLVVGGGGGAGFSGGGGGGGGGVQIVSNVWVNAGAYAVTVGQGGSGQTAVGTPAGNGGGSSVNLGSFVNLAVPGGGRGGFRRWNLPANAGGSGGGGGAPYGAYGDNDASNWDPFIAGALGVEPFGFAGGASTNWIDKTVAGYTTFKRFSCAGGGGVGAAGSGGNAAYEGIPSSSNRAVGGAGGAGVWCDFSGAMVEYGAGGAGGSAMVDNASVVAGEDGAAGTGRGGCGSGQSVDAMAKGGDGGCGCVLIRYRVIPRGMVINMR